MDKVHIFVHNKSKLTDWVIAAAAVGTFAVVAATAHELRSRIDTLLEILIHPMDTIKTQFEERKESLKPRRLIDALRNRWSKKED